MNFNRLLYSKYIGLALLALTFSSNANAIEGHMGIDISLSN